MTGTGIVVCGLNGAGKSTLGRALAEQLGCHFIDIEDLYFPKTSPDYLYADPRSNEEVTALLRQETERHPQFVLAAVRANYDPALYARFRCAVFLEVPKAVRLERVRTRSYQKFGERMRPGGDLYEREEAFFRFCEDREDSIVTDWLQTLSCPILRVDGTRPVEETAALLASQLA